MDFAEAASRTLDFLTQRKRVYQIVFGCPPGREVLEDLAKFCRASSTTFDPDPRIHAALEGRREVFLRIVEHMKLSPEELFELYKPRR